MPFNLEERDVQVIKTNLGTKTEKAPGDWSKTEKLAKEIQNLSLEIQESVDTLANKYNKLNEKLALAYKNAPLTDCGFGVSPIGLPRITHALKCHMHKREFYMDHKYLGDNTKFPDFSEYIKESMRWLLKFR